MNRKKQYPLYETTVFEDFRIMTENVALKYPERSAFMYKEDPHTDKITSKTFSETRNDIIALGTACIDLGCREKNAAIIGASSYGWVCTYFALMSIGSVTVPIDKDMPEGDIAGILERAECAFVFYGAEINEKVAALKEKFPNIKFVCSWGNGNSDDESFGTLIERGSKLISEGDNSYFDYEIDPDKLASIVFTSGTTGKGKGVMLSQTNIVSDMTQGMYNFAITEKTMCVLPPHHTFGSTVNFVGHYSQGCTIYLSSGLRYLLKELKEQQPTHLVLVPLFVETLYKRIWATAEKSGQAEKIRTGIKLSNFLRKFGIDKRRKLFAQILEVFGGKLEMIICGGAALNQDIIDMFDAIGITILNGYGITECAPLISCNRNEWQKNGSVGTPIIGEQVKIKDPDENGEGEICVKGPNVMLGYYKDEEATKAVFDEEGFFRTGDYGKLDSDGWLYITGRLKNLIIFSNGKNVYPEEIETELSRIYGISEVVVYAGESKANPQKEVIVAEIFPDYEALERREITGDENIEKYFKEEVRKANGNMVSYKSVGLVKIRKTEFAKNTSKKITRFSIDKNID